MTFLTIVQTALTIIGGVSVLLGVIAPLTKNQKDDKILYYIKKFLSMVSLNMSDKSLNINSNQLEIKIKQK